MGSWVAAGRVVGAVATVEAAAAGDGAAGAGGAGPFVVGVTAGDGCVRRGVVALAVTVGALAEAGDVGKVGLGDVDATALDVDADAGADADADAGACACASACAAVAADGGLDDALGMGPCIAEATPGPGCAGGAVGVGTELVEGLVDVSCQASRAMSEESPCEVEPPLVSAIGAAASAAIASC